MTGFGIGSLETERGFLRPVPRSAEMPRLGFLSRGKADEVDVENEDAVAFEVAEMPGRRNDGGPFESSVREGRARSQRAGRVGAAMAWAQVAKALSGSGIEETSYNACPIPLNWSRSSRRG